MDFEVDLTTELTIDLTAHQENVTTDSDKPDRITNRVTEEQKNYIIYFVMENPETISHSSTQASEAVLWNDLITHLNSLKPVKSLRNWRRYTLRLINHLKITPDLVLTDEETKFKRFVKKLLGTADPESTEEASETDFTEVVIESEEDIRNADKLELEKAKLKLDIIVNDLGVERLNNLILFLKGQNRRCLKKVKRLCANKAYLQMRLREFREARALSEE
ncbi:uncharacterized protein LOC100680214 [Nasonia vitripennis]|uniref:Uncharacterized protein n=1 Tax=Nasonia vitripennis TaxID=7425 RepID=A0A7M7QIU9_NASVI|nr:uncharacterized protein LOC100680214 [Nasonia vitripennis]XP_031786343.1 uncharacterized protein LOC100680214 [Nasonia vitripennis]